MKTKLMVVMVTLLFAISMMAQAVNQAAPAAPADKTNTCACCSGDKCPMAKGAKADGKSCCGDSCCKDGKCEMAAHKKDTAANGKSCCGEDCCKDGKCAMASKDGKGGCCGDKCPMMKQGAKSAKASGKDLGCCETAAVVACCHTGAACCKGGYMPCCDKSAA